MTTIWARQKENVVADVFSGMTVSLALIPEAIAFALVAGVSPLAGLYATVIVGFIAAAAGGRPGIISGATGALAVVMVNLVTVHGIEYLFAAVVLMGAIQVLAGVLRLGKFIWMVPYPVLIGAVNGLAIVIFIAQLEHFQIKAADGSLEWVMGHELAVLLGLVFGTMFIIKAWPLLTRKIPSSLVAILSVSLLVYFFQIETHSVGDMGSISGELPKFHIPNVPFNLETLGIVLPYAIILSMIGLIEALLTLGLIDEITQTHGNTNQECIGQGLANIVAGYFSTMGGCAMIGQSVLNVESGGRGRLSGMVGAACILFYVLYGGQWIEQIPIAALVGVMFIVVIETFEWSSFRILKKIPRKDAFILVVVSLTTVLGNLSVAVILGVIVAALFFAWEHAKHIQCDTDTTDLGVKFYKLKGPLFFSSVKYFKNLFTVDSDPESVIIEFKESRVCDHSAIKAIDDIAEQYQRAGKKLHILHLSPDCQKMLHKASTMIELDESNDPSYHIAVD